MIYPKWLTPGDTIGVTAPSCGIADEIRQNRFKNGVKNLNKHGIEVVMTPNVFKADELGVSSDGKTRAEEFDSLVSNSKVPVILSASGGDFMMEMLDYVDFENIKKNPTWFQGYSDNTHLTYSIATKCDVATIYGCNFGDFGMGAWQKPVEKAFDVLRGNIRKQESFDYFESTWHTYETGLEGYFADEKVLWRNGRGEKEIKVKGRLLGGCIDVISYLSGTKYDGTLSFVDKYSQDGILWYLESFDLNAEELCLTLWRLDQMGYFKNASGFIFGRPCMFSSGTGLTYDQAVMKILGKYNVPVIFDADVGHKGPQFSIINGAFGTFVSKDGKGSLYMELKND